MSQEKIEQMVFGISTMFPLVLFPYRLKRAERSSGGPKRDASSARASTTILSAKLQGSKRRAKQDLKHYKNSMDGKGTIKHRDGYWIILECLIDLLFLSKIKFVEL